MRDNEIKLIYTILGCYDGKELPVVTDETVSALYEIIKDLKEREQKVLFLYYGLDGEEPKSFKEIGEVFNVTSTIIKQNWAKAIKKLRHPNRYKKLLGIKMEKVEYEPTPTKIDLRMEDNSNLSLEELDFSVRTYNCLKRAGVENLNDLTTLPIRSIANIKNLGKKSLREILEKLIDLI